MFEVDHDHHGQEFTRFFSPGRSSMSAMDDKRAEAFRRHVWAVTMIDDEAPLPSSRTNRHSTQFVKENIKRPSANKLKRRRKSFPVKPLQEQQPQNQTQTRTQDEKPADQPQEKPQEKTQEKSKEKPREKSRLKPRLKIIEKRQQESQKKPEQKPEEKPQEKDTDRPLPVLPEPQKLSPPSYQEYYEKDSDAGFQHDLQVKYRERPQVQYKAYCPPYSLEENREIMKGPTVTVQPVQPSFGPVAELYSVNDDIEDFLAGSQKNQLPRTTYPTSFSVVHELETPASDPAKATESLPTTSLNKRKASRSSTASIASMYSNSAETMSLRSRQRTPSWGSKTSVDTNESTGWKPDYLTQQPLPIQAKSRTAPRATYRQNELFGMMPSEVLSLILSKLRDLHLEPGSISCSTCWMRDMCNLLVASRKWYKTARVTLYEDIQLVGSDSPAHKKKYKLNQGARIMMLRRTLRANPYLASLVRVLKVPAPEQSGKGINVNDYDDLVATLVMACPNLESLSGPTTTYDHSFKKLFHALSTRTKLKEMNWIIQVSPQQKQQRVQSGTPQPGLIMAGELMRFQEIAFLDHHVNWQHLETLSINCYPGASLNPEGLLTSTIEHLPSLKHLHLCNISRNGFNDNNLLALPALESLTLSHIPGITSNGLSSFATRSTSRSLRKLHLRHTPLTSLAALARILSNLRSLTSFALVQPSSPVMPEEDSFTLWMMPYLASSSLKKLHWDITAHALSLNNAADDILARSIVAGGFPELTTLRVHNDPDGIFQDLCLPKERMDLPSDRLHSVELPGDMPNMSPVSGNSPISPTRYGLFKTTSNNSIASLLTPQSPTPSLRHPLYTNLHASRLAAQARLEAARSRPRFTVNVIDEDGTTTETYAMAGFLGTFGSRIHYYLMPDANSVDEKGGLPDVRDIENDGGESLADRREGCSGRWNTRAGVVADRKEKETWYHTERGRWTKPTL